MYVRIYLKLIIETISIAVLLYQAPFLNPKQNIIFASVKVQPFPIIENTVVTRTKTYYA